MHEITLLSFESRSKTEGEGQAERTANRKVQDITPEHEQIRRIHNRRRIMNQMDYKTEKAFLLLLSM